MQMVGVVKLQAAIAGNWTTYLGCLSMHGAMDTGFRAVQGHQLYCASGSHHTLRLVKSLLHCSNTRVSFIAQVKMPYSCDIYHKYPPGPRILMIGLLERFHSHYFVAPNFAPLLIQQECNNMICSKNKCEASSSRNQIPSLSC